MAKKATLVSSTSPSGTMPTRPATAPCTASCHVSVDRLWLTNRRGPTTTIATATYLRMRLMPFISSDDVVV